MARYIIVVTRSHKMSLTLKFGNLRYPYASNLQILFAILIVKSRFYSKKCGCDIFLKVACVAKAILVYLCCSRVCNAWRNIGMTMCGSLGF